MAGDNLLVAGDRADRGVAIPVIMLPAAVAIVTAVAVAIGIWKSGARLLRLSFLLTLFRAVPLRLPPLRPYSPLRPSRPAPLLSLQGQQP